MHKSKLNPQKISFSNCNFIIQKDKRKVVNNNYTNKFNCKYVVVISL